MKNKTIVLLAALSLSGFSYANCGNDKDTGNGCSGDTGIVGPQGPTGPQGSSGVNGTNGVNGANGTNGVNGKDGKDGKDTSTQFKGTDLALDVAVRLIDAKYLQVQAFDTYVVGSTPGSDVFGDGRNQTIGARIVIKLGKSYEERLIEKQATELKAMQAALSRMQ